jgi:hypothetical protein
MENPADWRFIVDAMFGKLGIYLRLLGFDTEIAPNSLSDKDVFLKAQDEHRILITRDKGFYQNVKNKTIRINDKIFPAGVFIDEKRVINQIIGVFKTFELDIELLSKKTPEDLKSRCAKCNSPISKVDKAEIQSIIPPTTSERVDNYWRCTNPECQSLFWLGRHWVSIGRVFSEVKKNLEMSEKI